MPHDLRILLLSDGRAGHYNLSEGIVAAVARRRPVQVERREVRRRLPGHVAAGLLRAGLPASAVLRLAHGMVRTDLPAADLVVSAGAETMPGNIAAARLLGAPNVFYGSLRSYRPAWFTLSLTSYPAHARTPHPVMALKPSRLDPDTLPRLARPSGEAWVRRAALLMGGDGGGTRWSAPDWEDLHALLVATHRTHGTRWIVSSSRRTPDAQCERMAALAAAPGGAVETFIDVRTAGSGTLTGLFAAAEVVAVTADSSSMLSEAVWARRPVIALAPRRHQLTPEEASYRQWLAAAGTCLSLSLAQTTPEAFLLAARRIAPLAGNPLDQLAAVLAVHLPGLLAPAADSGP